MNVLFGNYNPLSVTSVSYVLNNKILEWNRKGKGLFLCTESIPPPHPHFCLICKRNHSIYRFCIAEYSNNYLPPLTPTHTRTHKIGLRLAQIGYFSFGPKSCLKKKSSVQKTLHSGKLEVTFPLTFCINDRIISVATKPAEEGD